MESTVTFTFAQMSLMLGIVAGVLGFLCGWLLTLLTSTSTTTRLNDHIVECSRRHQEVASRMDTLHSDIGEVRKGIEGLYRKGWWR